MHVILLPSHWEASVGDFNDVAPDGWAFEMCKDVAVHSMEQAKIILALRL